MQPWNISQVLTSGGSGSAVSWSTISTDLINDSGSPQLGGTLDTNNQNIHFNDNVSVRFSQDFDNHSGTNQDNNTGDIYHDDILIESADDFNRIDIDRSATNS